MLVLSRKQNQKIHIGDDITISVAELKGNQVLLGIDAPKDLPILREELVNQPSEQELVEKMQEEQRRLIDGNMA